MKIRNQAFTLIELLVVIAIIAILAADSFPSLRTGTRRHARPAALAMQNRLVSQANGTRRITMKSFLKLAGRPCSDPVTGVASDTKYSGVASFPIASLDIKTWYIFEVSIRLAIRWLHKANSYCYEQYFWMQGFQAM